MRICFELLDLLKAHKKGIRRAAVNTFGYIAKTLGPQDVLSVLLTNLRVQERQSRVCSTVAIGRRISYLTQDITHIVIVMHSHCGRNMWAVYLHTSHPQ
jgi:hypothetical protein